MTHLFALKRIVITALLIFTLSVIYSNCAQQIKSIAPSAQTIYAVSNEPEVSLQDSLARQFAGLLTEEMCFVSSRYSCDRRIFNSEGESYQELTQHPCLEVDQGPPLCTTGSTFHINSESRDQHCTQYPHDCPDPISNYEEYSCYYTLPDRAGRYPLHANKSTLAESLKVVLDSCLEVVKKSVTPSPQ